MEFAGITQILIDEIKHSPKGTSMDLSKKMGIPPAYVSNWVHGTKPIPRAVIHKVADYFGYEIIIQKKEAPDGNAQPKSE